MNELNKFGYASQNVQNNLFKGYAYAVNEFMVPVLGFVIDACSRTTQLKCLGPDLSYMLVQTSS